MAEHDDENAQFKVTREIVVEAPRGDHAEAARRAEALWQKDLEQPRTIEHHNNMAAHHDSLTVEVLDPRSDPRSSSRPCMERGCWTLAYALLLGPLRPNSSICVHGHPFVLTEMRSPWPDEVSEEDSG